MQGSDPDRKFIICCGFLDALSKPMPCGRNAMAQMAALPRRAAARLNELCSQSIALISTRAGK